MQARMRESVVISQSRQESVNKEVWEILAWRSVSGLPPQCWGWTEASSGGSCSDQSATGTGFSRVLRFTSVSTIPPILRTPIHSYMLSFINEAVFVCYESTASLKSNKIRWKSVVAMKLLHRDRRLDGPQKSLGVWGEQTLRKIWEPLKNSSLQKSDMKQVPFWIPTNVSDHRTKFSCTCEPAPSICAPLFYVPLQTSVIHLPASRGTDCASRFPEPKPGLSQHFEAWSVCKFSSSLAGATPREHYIVQ